MFTFKNYPDFKRPNIFWMAAFAMVAADGLDIVTTKVAAIYGLHEANPLMIDFFGEILWRRVFGIKSIYDGLLIVGMYLVYRILKFADVEGKIAGALAAFPLIFETYKSLDVAIGNIVQMCLKRGFLG